MHFFQCLATVPVSAEKKDLSCSSTFLHSNFLLLGSPFRGAEQVKVTQSTVRVIREMKTSYSRFTLTSVVTLAASTILEEQYLLLQHFVMPT